MDNNFLQEFLKTGLFEIGDSDERLTWLQNSISDLEKSLVANKSLLRKYTLIALDPHISDSDSSMIEVEKIITGHWKALRAKYPEMPRNIVRGVVINALYSVGKSNSHAARIIYFTALNFYPYAKLNSEKDLVHAMLETLGQIAEEHAIKEWSLNKDEPSLKVGSLKISSSKTAAIKIDDVDLRSALKVAAARTPEGYDPYSHPSQWSEHFSKNASPAIVALISKSISSLGKSLDTNALESSINKFFADFKKSLDKSLQTSFSSMKAVEKRSNLLWWKETLYSSSQKRSYRGVNKNLLPILMSADLNHQVPAVTPVSVDYLLRDTLFLTIEKQNEQISFFDYLTQVSNPEFKTILKTYFGNLDESVGRISITDFIALLVNERIEIKEFKTRTGIDETEVITLTDLSVVVFHDLLNQRLIAV